MATTTNRANRYPASTDPANVPTDLQNLANDLDNVANIYTGTFAARPAASASAGHGAANSGSFYYSTDTSELFVSVAGSWIKVTTEPGIPLGGMISYGGQGDPADTRFLLADGRPLARTGTYAPLFAIIGTVYGTGDGSTTFNIPDKRGRALVGQDNMSTARGAAGLLPNSSRTIGASGGAERTALAVADMPSHAHSISDPGHAHSIYDPGHGHVVQPDAALYNTVYGASGVPVAANGTVYTGGGAYPLPRQVLGTDARGTGIGIYAAGTGVAVAAAGSGTAHNNMQPYQVDNVIVRVR